eukprot:12060070-Karenia_brevis.AAC.1
MAGGPKGRDGRAECSGQEQTKACICKQGQGWMCENCCTASERQRPAPTMRGYRAEGQQFAGDGIGGGTPIG